VSIPEEHISLFKADWIGDPDRLKTLARHQKYNDLFTAELAAWCAEVHEHLHDLEDTVGVELLLMGGNAASLRFDAIQQRGSRLPHGREPRRYRTAHGRLRRTLPDTSPPVPTQGL
jgi:hypothetical protein